PTSAATAEGSSSGSSRLVLGLIWTSYRGRRVAPRRLLPLDRARGLARDVEHHAPDGADLVDHPARDLLEQVIREPRPVGGHRVVAGYRANHDHVALGAGIALH